jgi:hypothetical protein
VSARETGQRPKAATPPRVQRPRPMTKVTSLEEEQDAAGTAAAAELVAAAATVAEPWIRLRTAS